MRVVYCFCGHLVEGITDTNLFQRYREHQNHEHPANQSTDTHIWSVIKANAYEKRGVQHHRQVSLEHQTNAD